MRKLIQLIMIMVSLNLASCEPALPASLTAQGGWEHLGNSNYSDAIEADVRAETQLYRHLNIGLEGGYHGKSTHEHYGDLSGYSLLGELIYYPDLHWKVQPYILGGLGWSWWHFDRNQDMIDKGIIINLGNSFAKKVGIGVDYAIGGNWSLNLEWNYFQSDIPKDSHYESDGSFANVVGAEKTVGEEETSLVIGIRYTF